jgi:TPR repeat protein
MVMSLVGTFVPSHRFTSGNGQPVAQFCKPASDERASGALASSGLCLEFGRGIEQDLHYYGLSAKQGDRHAQNLLGACFGLWKGFEVDLHRAVEWYKITEDNGGGAGIGCDGTNSGYSGSSSVGSIVIQRGTMTATGGDHLANEKGE